MKSPNKRFRPSRTWRRSGRNEKSSWRRREKKRRPLRSSKGSKTSRKCASTRRNSNKSTRSSSRSRRPKSSRSPRCRIWITGLRSKRLRSSRRVRAAPGTALSSSRGFVLPSSQEWRSRSSRGKCCRRKNWVRKSSNRRVSSRASHWCQNP